MTGQKEQEDQEEKQERRRKGNQMNDSLWLHAERSKLLHERWDYLPSESAREWRMVLYKSEQQTICISTVRLKFL